MKRCVVLLTCCCFLFSVSCAANKAVRKDKAETARRLGEGYLATGNLSAALRELLRAEELYDKDPYVSYALGLAYFAKKEFALAISSFERAIELKSDYSEAFNAMGAVYLRLRKWDKAIPHFNKSRENLLYATPHVALNNLGEAYRGKKEYRRAIEFYKKAIDDNPRFARAHQNLGVTYLALGDYDAAVSSLKKAAHYAPRTATVHYDLGTAYAGQYKRKEAIDAFKKVVALIPGSELADRAQEEIRQMEQ